MTTDVRKWCQYLARGGHLTRCGMHFSPPRYCGQLTFNAISNLEAAGLVTLEPTATDKPECRHVRAVLTPAGIDAAALPVQSFNEERNGTQSENA